MFADLSIRTPVEFHTLSVLKGGQSLTKKHYLRWQESANSQQATAGGVFGLNAEITPKITPCSDITPLITDDKYKKSRSKTGI